MGKRIKTFFNDRDGLTLTDTIAILFTLSAVVGYFLFKTMDTNYADIVIASIFVAAGQKVGTGIINKRGSREINAPGEEG